MTPTRPALKYYGGKWKTAPWIISFFPEHINYLEPCGGAASVLLQKEPAVCETYNDIDDRCFNFFKVLRENSDELVQLIRLTPHSKTELKLSTERSEDEVEDARRFFVLCWQSFSQSTQTWRSLKNPIGQRPIYLNMIEVEHLLMASERLQSVQFENGDALQIIKKYDTQDTLIYFDPPYHPSTRKYSDRYLFETSKEFHEEAAELLNQVKGMVIVSGYNCKEYQSFYEKYGWKRFDKAVVCNAGAKRVESIWLSPKTQEALTLPVQTNFFEEVV